MQQQQKNRIVLLKLRNREWAAASFPPVIVVLQLGQAGQ